MTIIENLGNLNEPLRTTWKTRLTIIDLGFCCKVRTIMIVRLLIIGGEGGAPNTEILMTRRKIIKLAARNQNAGGRTMFQKTSPRTDLTSGRGRTVKSWTGETRTRVSTRTRS